MRSAREKRSNGGKRSPAARISRVASSNTSSRSPISTSAPSSAASPASPPSFARSRAPPSIDAARMRLTNLLELVEWLPADYASPGGRLRRLAGRGRASAAATHFAKEMVDAMTAVAAAAHIRARDAPSNADFSERRTGETRPMRGRLSKGPAWRATAAATTNAIEPVTAATATLTLRVSSEARRTRTCTFSSSTANSARARWVPRPRPRVDSNPGTIASFQMLDPAERCAGTFPRRGSRCSRTTRRGSDGARRCADDWRGRPPHVVRGGYPYAALTGRDGACAEDLFARAAAEDAAREIARRLSVGGGGGEGEGEGEDEGGAFGGPSRTYRPRRARGRRGRVIRASDASE